MVHFRFLLMGVLLYHDTSTFFLEKDLPKLFHPFLLIWASHMVRERLIDLGKTKHVVVYLFVYILHPLLRLGLLEEVVAPVWNVEHGEDRGKGHPRNDVDLFGARGELV